MSGHDFLCANVYIIMDCVFINARGLRCMRVDV